MLSSSFNPPAALGSKGQQEDDELNCVFAADQKRSGDSGGEDQPAQWGLTWTEPSFSAQQVSLPQLHQRFGMARF